MRYTLNIDTRKNLLYTCVKSEVINSQNINISTDIVYSYFRLCGLLIQNSLHVSDFYELILICIIYIGKTYILEVPGEYKRCLINELLRILMYANEFTIHYSWFYSVEVMSWNERKTMKIVELKNIRTHSNCFPKILI